MRPLMLTSPHMKGKDVLEAQYLLNKNGFDVGKPDGEFGPITANATADAKWALGYPAKQITSVFGQLLHDILSGKVKPGPLYRMRAKARAKAANETQQKVEAVLTCGLHQIGTKEDPKGSNRVKYSLWYAGTGFAWCAAFISWCVEVLCHHPKKLKFHYAYVPYIVADARAHRNGLSEVSRAPVDTLHLRIACFDWEGNGVADHVGFTVPEKFLLEHFPLNLARARKQFGKLGAGDFWSLEGNTSPNNDSNGGEVWLRKRNEGDVQAFVQIKV